MTTTVTVALICDDPRHFDEAEAVATRAITIDGVDYELELCAAHDDEYQAALTPFLSNARVVKRTAPPKVRRSTRDQEQRRRTAVVRAWWREHPHAVPGVTYSDRGRMPKGVAEAYAQR